MWVGASAELNLVTTVYMYLLYMYLPVCVHNVYVLILYIFHTLCPTAANCIRQVVSLTNESLSPSIFSFLQYTCNSSNHVNFKRP